MWSLYVGSQKSLYISPYYHPGSQDAHRPKTPVTWTDSNPVDPMLAILRLAPLVVHQEQQMYSGSQSFQIKP